MRNFFSQMFSPDTAAIKTTTLQNSFCEQKSLLRILAKENFKLRSHLSYLDKKRLRKTNISI